MESREPSSTFFFISKRFFSSSPLAFIDGGRVLIQRACDADHARLLSERENLRRREKRISLSIITERTFDIRSRRFGGVPLQPDGFVHLPVGRVHPHFLNKFSENKSFLNVY